MRRLPDDESRSVDRCCAASWQRARPKCTDNEQIGCPLSRSPLIPGCPLAFPPIVTRGRISPRKTATCPPVYKLDCRAVNASTRIPFWSNESARARDRLQLPARTARWSRHIMRHARVGGTPSAFELVGKHRYARARAAQAASKN